MKKLLIVLGMFALVGGGVAALWFLDVPPFGSSKSAKKTGAKKDGKGALPERAAPAAEPLTDGTATDGTGLRSGAAFAAASEEGKASSSRTAARVTKPAPPQMTEADLARMASVYEQMSIEEAAPILDRLPDNAVEPLLRRMDDRQVGKLLATFKPERAAKLTLAMTRSASAIIAANP